MNADRLIYGQGRKITPGVLKQQDPATGFHHPGHLLQRPGRVAEHADRKGGDNAVKGVVLKGQCLCISWQYQAEGCMLTGGAYSVAFECINKEEAGIVGKYHLLAGLPSS